MPQSEALVAAVACLSRYVQMRREKPIRIDDEIHGVHVGTEWEASLRLSDLETAIAALTTTAEEDTVTEAIVAALIAEKDDPRHADSPNLRAGLQVAIQIVRQAIPVRSIQGGGWLQQSLARADGRFEQLPKCIKSRVSPSTPAGVADEVERLLARCPQLEGIEGTEPSVRELVHAYYRRHMPKSDADKYAAAYLAALQHSTTPESGYKLVSGHGEPVRLGSGKGERA